MVGGRRGLLLRLLHAALPAPHCAWRVFAPTLGKKRQDKTKNKQSNKPNPTKPNKTKPTQTKQTQPNPTQPNQNQPKPNEQKHKSKGYKHKVLYLAIGAIGMRNGMTPGFGPRRRETTSWMVYLGVIPSFPNEDRQVFTARANLSLSGSLASFRGHDKRNHLLFWVPGKTDFANTDPQSWKACPHPGCICAFLHPRETLGPPHKLCSDSVSCLATLTLTLSGLARKTPNCLIEVRNRIQHIWVYVCFGTTSGWYLLLF